VVAEVRAGALTSDEAMAALVADVGRKWLWSVLSEGFTRTACSADTPEELVAATRALCPELDYHPVGALEAARKALAVWASGTPVVVLGAERGT
jgi:hypothetical protein